MWADAGGGCSAGALPAAGRYCHRRGILLWAAGRQVMNVQAAAPPGPMCYASTPGAITLSCCMGIGVQPNAQADHVFSFRACVRGALKGCLALVLRKAAGNAAAPAPDATAATVILKRFQQYILVQAFGQVERMLSFELVLAAIQVRMQDVLKSSCTFCCAGSVHCASAWLPRARGNAVS